MAGLRRVEQIHLVVGKGRPVALVSGVGHRCRRQFRISMATASRLVEAGVPCRFEYRDGASASEVG